MRCRMDTSAVHRGNSLTGNYLLLYVSRRISAMGTAYPSFFLNPLIFFCILPRATRLCTSVCTVLCPSGVHRQRHWRRRVMAHCHGKTTGSRVRVVTAFSGDFQTPPPYRRLPLLARLCLPRIRDTRAFGLRAGAGAGAHLVFESRRLAACGQLDNAHPRTG
jgi:hypothetical protein